MWLVRGWRIFCQPRCNKKNMASIEDVATAVGLVAEGLEGSVLSCMKENAGIVVNLVREQLYSGRDGSGEYLSPSYDNDPYFQEEGPWQGRASAYKEWKKRITPPQTGLITGLSARPDDIPNLFISGTFHNSIKSKDAGDGLDIVTDGFKEGPAIERKYGADIFNLSDTSLEWFITDKVVPHLLHFFEQCRLI